MRRAFTVTINRTQQFELMLEMFRQAKLEYLQVESLVIFASFQVEI